MNIQRTVRALAACLALFAAQIPGTASEGKALSVAVADSSVRAIVKAVGGNQVVAFSLFKGCVLRKDLEVEPAAKARLNNAAAIVWTGFFQESEAINAVLRDFPAHKPLWIDVAPGATRTKVPFTTCEGFVDPLFAAGDPYFWLNPQNGSIIARNVAKGLSRLLPGQAKYFHANAAAFSKSLGTDIARWKKALEPLNGMRVYSAQCGWQNFSSLGGPKFILCKTTPGELPAPKELLAYVKQMEAKLILVDPNTAPEFAEALREHSGLKVIEVPSSLDGFPGERSYNSLFDSLVKVLLGALTR